MILKLSMFLNYLLNQGFFVYGFQTTNEFSIIYQQLLQTTGVLLIYYCFQMLILKLGLTIIGDWFWLKVILHLLHPQQIYALRFANLVSLFVNFSHIIKNPTNGLSLPVTKNMRVIFLVFLHPIL